VYRDWRKVIALEGIVILLMFKRCNNGAGGIAQGRAPILQAQALSLNLSIAEKKKKKG
jgi:hypothetical protein